MKLANGRFLTILALSASLMAVGCGGGSSKKGGGSASTAAGVTSAVRNMAEGRAQHRAVLLKNGTIFVAGGMDSTGSPMASTVLISPTDVKSGPSLAIGRTGHSLTLLNSGQVLIAGGQSDAAGTKVLDDSEIFDPLTGQLTAGPKMDAARSGHVAHTYFVASAAGQQDEFVLFAGGVAAVNTLTNQAASLDSAEVWDVAQNTVATLTAKLSEAQTEAKIALLDNGKLLIVGGKGANGGAAVNVYDPATQSFAAVTAVAPRSGAAVASKGQEVLIAGGVSAAGVEDTSEVYDSASNTIAQGQNLGQRRSAVSATLLKGDAFLVGGKDGSGFPSAIVEKVSGANFGQAVVTSHTALLTARYAHAAVAAANGDQVIVIGGYDASGAPLSSIETVNFALPAAPVTVGTTAPGSTGPATTTSGGATTGTPTGIVPAPGTGTTTPGSTGTTGGSTGSTPPSSGGLGGLLGGLFGGGSGSTGGSGGSSLTSTLLQSAVQALTQSSGSGSGFSGFMQNFVQNVLRNMIGGGSSSGSSNPLTSLLSGLLGGGSGSGSTGGSSNPLSSLLSGLLGGGSGSSGGSASSGGGLGGLLSGLFGGGSGSSSGSTGSGSTGTTTPPANPNALTISSMTPTSGPIGTVVTIEGTNFGANVGISFNGVQSTITSAQRSAAGVVTLVCTVPQGATTGPCQVASGGQTVVAGTFTVQ